MKRAKQGRPRTYRRGGQSITVYVPNPVAKRLDEISKRLGLSRSRLAAAILTTGAEKLS